MPNRVLQIAVLSGGPSAERAVSLCSGASVTAALAARGHQLTGFDPNAGLPMDVALGTPELLEAAATAVARHDWSDVDVVFNALHGTFGEDGRLQAVFDRRGVAYTGSGAAASRIGFGKSLARRHLERAGVPVPRGIVISASDPLDRLEIASERFGYPVVLKPDAQGSSLGVSIVTGPGELAAAVEQCFAFGSRALLEEYISGTEWTVPVWDDAALPRIQIVPGDGFYDYRAKYHDDRTEYRLEPDASSEIADRIAEAGLRAARAVGATGLSRVDLRVRPDGEPFVLEINTSPGMTDHSLVPKAAAHMGLTLGELCEQECRRAIARQVVRTRGRAAA